MEPILNYFEKNIDLYLGQFEELRHYYPNLVPQMRSGNLSLRGRIYFNEDFGTGLRISDSYVVEIGFSPDYPYVLPSVRETGGKIDCTYPHLNKDGAGTLCLGTYVDLWLRFSEKRTILHFVYNLLIPALYAHAFWLVKHTMPPWGDRPHRVKGIIQFYSEIFESADVATMLELLNIIITGEYTGNSHCPCGSQKTLNECHGAAVFRLWHVPFNYILYDYVQLDVVEKALGLADNSRMLDRELARWLLRSGRNRF